MPLSHVVADHDDGGQGSRRDHYLEWARLVYPEAQGRNEQSAVAHSAHIYATSDSIHLHVWTQVGLLELLLHCRTRLGSFEIEAARRLVMENIGVEDGPEGVGSPLETQVIELERELTDARRDAKRARTEAHVLDQRVKSGEQVLADVLNSASWRLTKPPPNRKAVRCTPARLRKVNRGGTGT
jgi:hypothetical protein